MYLFYFVSWIFIHQVTIAKGIPSTDLPKNGDEFDFIVVGGGTGGCVVASRLAESGKHSVLLIEDGGIPNSNLTIPGLSTWDSFSNEMKYYYSVPQFNSSLGRNNGVIQFGIGKTMGGGSSVNGMFWNRGNPKDYNNWARLTNDESWNYLNLVKYFKRVENYVGFNAKSNHRGYSGPIMISNPIYTPGMKEFIAAGKEIGYPFGDANGPQTPSVAKVDFNQESGRRVSSYSGYIEPLLHPFQDQTGNRKLKILMNSEVKRIIFEGTRAVGVTYLNDNGKSRFVKAKKEIILSAGVMDSPTLLMRSGVGPEDVLVKAKIPVIKSLPVGKNLQDHSFLQIPVILGNRSAVFIPERDLTPEAWKLYEDFGEGPYSSLGGSGAQGLFLSSLQESGDWPDFQIVPLNSEDNSTLAAAELEGVDDLKEFEAVVKWYAVLTRPKSRGIVFLNPEDVEGPPVIDFRFFTHPDDTKVMADALKTLQKLCESTKAMERIGCRLPSKPFPACKHLKFKSDEYWRCYIAQLSDSDWHAAGTCRMGRESDDPEAVVDSKLRVIGIQGLRVADASIMPLIINANPQAAVFMIAEKVSELILNCWKK